MLTALFVVARIVANPLSNVFQKQLTQRAANPLFIIGATDAILAVAVLPLFLLGAVPLALAPGFWTNMAICATLAVAINVLLVFELALLLFRRRREPAFFAAALWAVHPIHTECVANVAGRADLLFEAHRVYARMFEDWTPCPLLGGDTERVRVRDRPQEKEEQIIELSGVLSHKLHSF